MQLSQNHLFFLQRAVLVIPAFVVFTSACPTTGLPINNNNNTDDDGGTVDDGGNNVAPVGNTCEVNGVDVVIPTSAAVLGNGNPPDLSCVTTPNAVTPGPLATAEGCIDIFGLGGKAKPGLKVSFYADTQDPATEAPAFGETDIAVKSQAGPLQERAAACDKEGFYRLENVPTNTKLIVKVSDTATGPAQTAMPTYTYNVILQHNPNAIDPNTNVQTVNYAANLVYKTTYDSIPTLGGKRIDGQQIVYDNIGRGVIAGEIQDCRGDTIKNVSVSTDQFDSNTKMSYFNGDLGDPTPDLTLKNTNVDGLYVVLNASTDPGKSRHTISGGYVASDCTGADCVCQSLGSQVVNVLPDSVTIVTFPSDEPTVAAAQ